MGTVAFGCSHLLSKLLFFCFLFCILQAPVSAVKKSYIVYLGEHSHDSNEEFDSLIQHQKVHNSHYELLGSMIGSKKKAQDAIFYSYTSNINGFAAILEEEEAMQISKNSMVMSVFPNKRRKLHTTHSWSFLGLERDGRVPKESIWTKARFGQDTIIGNLDTGVWPESDSFNDEGMGPIPSKWRGICQTGVGDDFRCNRKLIGARYFNKGFTASLGLGIQPNSTYNTPRDPDGHGTHTLSTAAGRFVPRANIFGFGNGTAKGGSPGARVAAYRVCYPAVNDGECDDADILAAFDAAISDGVDVLSVSLGGSVTNYFNDTIAIGSFHAIKKGIVVVCSAGNEGPRPETVENVAPWIITVGASTMDREFPAYVSLGNGKQLKGESLSETKIPEGKFYKLISSVDAKYADATTNESRLCLPNSLDPSKVKGKIVACLRGINARVEKGEVIRRAGGIGMILSNDITTENEIIADAHLLPATHISYSSGLTLFSYINSTKSPVAYIGAPNTVFGIKPAPFMAAFSSQGPNILNPEILKPDITAPGVSVLAAFTGDAGPSNLLYDLRRVRFNSITGTSMSCPHVSGVVGLLKTMYPDWSPSAIKSAIMTTARTRDNTQMALQNASFVKASTFSYGAGHINPNRAMNPGLVYDLTVEDYLKFLCADGYNSSFIRRFSPKSFTCPSTLPKLTDLNYPSITIPNLSGVTTVRRKLKNVGSPGTYVARVSKPNGVSVVVEPSSLTFTRVGEEKSFTVTFEAKGGRSGRGYVSGRLIWSDGVHFVRSPLVVQT